VIISSSRTSWLKLPPRDHRLQLHPLNQWTQVTARIHLTVEHHMDLLLAPQLQLLTTAEAMARTHRAMDTNPEQELDSDLGKEGYVMGSLVCSSFENSTSLGLLNLLLVL